MTSHATNRREGVSTSGRGCSRKIRAFTSKELETARADQELLGALTIGGGCLASQGVVVEGVKEVK